MGSPKMDCSFLDKKHKLKVVRRSFRGVIGTFIGTSIYKFYDYHVRSDLYALTSEL